MNANAQTQDRVAIRDQVLEYLTDKPPRSVPEIAEALKKEPTNLNRIVKDLVDAGLLVAEARGGPRPVTVYSRMVEEYGADGHPLDEAPPSPPAPHVFNPVLSRPDTPSVRPTVMDGVLHGAPPVTPTTPTEVQAAPVVKRRKRRISANEFVRTFERMRRDSETLQAIRALLAKLDDEPEEDTDTDE